MEASKRNTDCYLIIGLCWCVKNMIMSLRKGEILNIFVILYLLNTCKAQLYELNIIINYIIIF